MFVQQPTGPNPAALQAPGESTLMYVPPPGVAGIGPGAKGGAPVPSAARPPQQQPYAQAQPQHPGSQPPPGFMMQQQPMPGHDPRRMPMPQTPNPGFHPPGAPSGVPPQLPLQGRPDPRMVVLTEPDSARAVSFRLLRDSLLAKRLPRVLAVSSPECGDGKTTCALNLALSLAERAKVLVLDGNFLEPELTQIFGIPDGIPAWPQNAAWLAPYRIVEVLRGLHIAGLVPPPGSLPTRFEKQWFETLIAALRRFPYDFIIIDAAAILESPTVTQLIATADATLLAVRAGATTARALRRANDQIPEGRGIGVALVDATVRT